MHFIISDLPDYSKITFPETDPVPLEEILSQDGGPLAVQLFTEFIQYDTAKRLSACEALDHPFFLEDPIPASPKEMPIPKAKMGNLNNFDFRVDLSLQEITAELNDLV